MVKRHLSRLAAPKNWLINRKVNKWIVRPLPGPHPLRRCLPLNLILKEILGFADTTKETKKILNDKEVLIDKKIRRNYKFPVGIMDILEFPKTNQYFRLLFNKKGKFILSPIKKEESNVKPCKVINKTILKKGKLQLNLYDGKNILVEKDTCKVGDTILIDLTNNKIVDHIKLENGVFVYLLEGKYIGQIGVLKNILKSTSSQSDKIVLDIDGKEVKTLKEYAFVIGKTKPVISLGER